MSILVVAEHTNQRLRPATQHAVAAALQCGAEVHILVAGHNANASAQAAAQIQGVAKVLHADAPHLAYPLAENLAAQVLTGTQVNNYNHIIFAATTNGKNTAPRVAAKLDVAQISEVSKVIRPDTFQRSIYTGNGLETVQSTDATKVLTIRTTAFDAVGTGGNAPIEVIEAVPDTGLSQFVSMAEHDLDRPDLTSARVVVSGGIGLGGAEQFDALLNPLADKLNAAIGASRAAVDAHYAPNALQVGQTGKVVAPELYIAVGLSGAIQHLAGMKESKVIVAINSDPEAPIVGVADYFLKADLFTAVPELIQAL